MRNSHNSHQLTHNTSGFTRGAQHTDRSTESTESLWQATHAALSAGLWSKARALLDDLGRRSDVRDYLAPLAAYAERQLVGPGHAWAVLSDRIDLVNAHVDASRA